MAHIDSNIYLQQQAPDIVGAYEKGMKISALAQDYQMKQRQMDEDQGVRNAFKNNMVTHDDGTTTMDRGALLSDVAKASPTKYLDLQSQFAQQDSAQYQMQQKKRLDQADLIASAAGSATDQKSYVDALKYLGQNGVDTSQMPSQYDPTLVKNYQMHALSAKDQIANQIKQSELSIKQTEGKAAMLKAQAAAAEAGIPYSGAGGGGGGADGAGHGGAPGGGGSFVAPPKMQQKGMVDYTNMVNGSRMQPDAAQSLKDIQAAQKLNEIASIAPNGDLNKLNPQQTKLAIMEAVKMAGGSVPTESELESMTPNNLAQKYASSLQHLTNKSQAANAGEFIQQAIDYAHGIQTVGAQKLADRANEIADRQRPFLGEKGYQMIKGQIADEYKRNMPPQKAGKSGVMSFEQWKASKGSGN